MIPVLGTIDSIGLTCLTCQLTGRPHHISPRESIWPELEQQFEFRRCEDEPHIANGKFQFAAYHNIYIYLFSGQPPPYSSKTVPNITGSSRIDNNEWKVNVGQIFRQRLQATGLDHDAINMIVKVGKRTDLPTSLGNQWEAQWDSQALQDLVKLSPADRQHALAQLINHFLQTPLNLFQRVKYAANHSHDADLRTSGELAVDLQDIITAFGQDVMVSTISPFTAKVKYATVTDLDVVTTKAIIEVSTQHDAAGKVAQLMVLQGVVANPHGLPIFHLFPNINLSSAAAHALMAAGSAGVYNDRIALAVTVRSLP